MERDWYFDANTPDARIEGILKKLAESFARTHRDYLKFHEDESGKPGDIGWFYNERPNIGFLAAAAWRIPGWVALEEFTTEKRKAGKKGYGRADLYIGVPVSRNRFFSLGIEGKLAFVGSRSIRSALDPKNKRSALARAIEDAKRIRLDLVDYRIAAVFLCPGLKDGKTLKESLDRVGEQFWNECRRLNKHKLPWVAFSFVPKNVPPSFRVGKARMAYPAIGVVMVGV